MDSLTKKISSSIVGTGLCLTISGLGLILSNPHFETKTDVQFPNPVSFKYTGKKIDAGKMYSYNNDGTITYGDVLVDETIPNKPTSHWVDVQNQFVIGGQHFNIGDKQRIAYNLSEKQVLIGKLGEHGSITDKDGRTWNQVGLGHDSVGYK